MPWPCSAEIGIGSPRPSRWNSSASVSRRGSSILLTSRSTGFFAARRIAAISSSPGVIPLRASTRKSTRSASSIPARACSAIERVIGVSSAMSTPPVSIRRNSLPFHSQISSLRSRVTPGVSWTTAARVPVSRLIRVDLPTFGKPTIATVPCRLVIARGARRRPAGRARASGRAIPRAAAARARSRRTPRGTPSRSGAAAEKSIGSPQAIEAGWKLPGRHVCEPWIAAAWTGTPSCSATIAAPGCAWPGTPLSCRVPSTKRPSACPCRAASRMSRTASRSDSPRRTEIVPKARISWPSPGARCASTLAT